jgi:hypothetical protein
MLNPATNTCFCPTGFFPLGFQCLICQPSCVSCSSLDRCQQCKNNLLNQQGLCACAPGQILAQQACINCDNGCSGCVSSPSACTGCLSGYYLT